MSARYPDIRQGETAMQIEFSRTYADGTRATFGEGTIEVLDADGNPLAGFATPFDCEVSEDTYELTFRPAAWGDDAGELAEVDAPTERYVKWCGTDTDGNEVVSPAIPWRHLPRRK